MFGAPASLRIPGTAWAAGRGPCGFRVRAVWGLWVYKSPTLNPKALVGFSDGLGFRSLGLSWWQRDTELVLQYVLRHRALQQQRNRSDICVLLKPR